jgi:hypothetical protein
LPSQNNILGTKNLLKALACWDERGEICSCAIGYTMPLFPVLFARTTWSFYTVWRVMATKGNGPETINDLLWLPTEREMFGTIDDFVTNQSATD